MENKVNWVQVSLAAAAGMILASLGWVAYDRQDEVVEDAGVFIVEEVVDEEISEEAAEDVVEGVAEGVEIEAEVVDAEEVE